MFKRLKKIQWPSPKLSDVLFGIICLFLIGYILSALTNTGVKFFIVRSGSMKPAINVGDVAIITFASDSTKIQKNDVIAFQSPELKETIIHRVLEVTPDGYITKGDANEGLDLEPVKPDKVIGIYHMRIPLLGFFFEGIKHLTQWSFGETRAGWALIGIISTFFVFSFKRKTPVSLIDKQGEEEHK